MSMIHSVVWCHRAPANHARCDRGGERKHLRSGHGRRRRRIGEVLAANAQHNDESDSIGNPGHTLPPDRVLSGLFPVNYTRRRVHSPMDDFIHKESHLKNLYVNLALENKFKLWTYD